MKIEGVVSGLLTPFANDETVNFQVLKEETLFAIERCGSTAVMVAAAEVQETVRLTQEEKVSCMKAVVDSANGKVPVLVGASGTSTHGAIQLARQANDIGADAIVVMPPYGVAVKRALAPPTVQEAIEFYTELSQAVDLPIVLYNTTTLSTHLPIEALARIFELDNVVGMEESSADYQEISRLCMTLADKVTILVRGDLLLPTLELGGHGSIMPVGYSRIGADLYHAYRDHHMEKAVELQRTISMTPPEELLQRPRVAFFKEILNQLGLEVGLPRRPSTPLNEQEKNRVTIFVKENGLDRLKLE